jgi:hypothetical protein
MKDNYNIKINPPKLSSEQIEKHKNFDALLEQFNQSATKKKSANKTKVRYMILASVAVAASLAFLLIYRGLFNEEKQENMLALKQPFSKIDIGFSNYQVDAEKGDTLMHESGSMVVVPAAAFVDEKGKPVSGKVDIQYREMNAAADKFIAGVPQNAENTVLQSAAMMQIQGFKDGKPVFIGKDKELQIELKSDVSSNLELASLKSFSYDAKEKDWKEGTNVKTELLVVEEQSVKNEMPKDLYENEFRVIVNRKFPKPVKPVEPSKGVPQNMIALGFDINVKEFPEFEQYENVDWMAAKSIVEPLPSEGWSNMKVNRIADLRYEIVMIPNEISKRNGRTEVRFDAYPLIPFTKKNLMDYERAMVDYKKAMEEREKNVSKELALLEKRYQNTNAQDVKEAKKAKFTIQTVMSRFSIKEFGMWAAANRFNLKSLPTINASFKDESGKKVDVAEVFVSNAEKQLYFSSANKSSLPLDSDSEHQQVWVLSNGQLYVATPSPKKEADKVEFVLKPALQPKNVQEIRDELI